MNNLIDIAVAAVKKASEEILKVYNSASFEIETKGDNSPLTLADKRAHAAIVDILGATKLPILSEEGKDIPYPERKTWKRFWMVDPLDGTKEFIKRNGEFTVNIALIENQRPVLGVVAVPITGEIYYAANGIGAFKIKNGNANPLVKPQKKSQSESGIRVVASRSHLNEATQNFISTLTDPQLVSKGSSLKFMMLADGVADVYPRFAPTMEWDTAAAHAIVNQLDFKVLRQGSSEELIYNKENLLNPGFIVG